MAVIMAEMNYRVNQLAWLFANFGFFLRSAWQREDVIQFVLDKLMQ